MSQRTPLPERTVGTRCGAMVEHVSMAYPCTLEQGHAAIPRDDPEPHFAVEVPRSVTAWQQWKNRQDSKAKPDPAASLAALHARPEPVEHEVTATIREKHCDFEIAHVPHLWLADETAAHQNFCDGTGVRAEAVVDDAPEPPSHPSEDLGTPVVVDRREDGVEVVQTMAEFAHGRPGQATEAKACPYVGYAVHPEHLWTAEGQTAPFRCAGCTAEELFTPAPEPTKQREGDQPLPTGGQRCVQDLVIEAMQESKRVGMERYGSVLMTFNGRKGIQDIAEEARDLMVYATQIEAEAQADRATLIDVVAQEIRVRDGNHTMGAGALATVAVDAIMGWVIGNRGS